MKTKKGHLLINDGNSDVSEHVEIIKENIIVNGSDSSEYDS